MLHVSKILERSANNGEYTTIAVDGPGGSGKSEVGGWLKKLLPNFVLLEGDDYFEPLTDLPPGMRGGFNAERFMLDVGHSIQRGERALNYRPYSWDIQGPKYDGATQVPSGGGVIVEGIKSLSLPVDWDAKILVTAPRYLREERFMRRSETERRVPNQTPEDLLRRFNIWADDAEAYMESLPMDEVIVINGVNPLEEQIQL